MTSPHITYVTEDNFEQEVLKSDKMVLLDFYADWCGPCRALGPTLEKFAEDKSAAYGLKVAKTNTDENQKLLQDHKVRGIPTLIMFNNGKEIGRLVGNQTQQQLEAFYFDCKQKLVPTKRPPSGPSR